MALDNREIKKQSSRLQGNKSAATSAKTRQPAQGKAAGTQPAKAFPDVKANRNKKAGTSAKTVSNVLGEITWLMTQSASHRYFFISDLEWMILQPVSLGQFRIFHGEKFPVGAAFWAFASKEVEERIRKGITRMRPGDWNSGKRLWLIDLITPFGSGHKMLEDLEKNVFPDNPFKYLQRNEEGAMMVMESGKSTTTAKAREQ